MRYVNALRVSGFWPDHSGYLLMYMIYRPYTEDTYVADWNVTPTCYAVHYCP